MAAKLTPNQVKWRLGTILVCALLFAASFLDRHGAPAGWRLSTWVVAVLSLCLFALFALVLRRSNR